MTRVTKPELMNFFMWLCHDMGKKCALSSDEVKAVLAWRYDKTPDSIPCEIVPYHTIGAWDLDYAGSYGGWVIKEICTEGGGISHPFGSNRCSARELLDKMSFARECFSIISK